MKRFQRTNLRAAMHHGSKLEPATERFTSRMHHAAGHSFSHGSRASLANVSHARAVAAQAIAMDGDTVPFPAGPIPFTGTVGANDSRWFLPVEETPVATDTRYRVAGMQPDR